MRTIEFTKRTTQSRRDCVGAITWAFRVMGKRSWHHEDCIGKLHDDLLSITGHEVWSRSRIYSTLKYLRDEGYLDLTSSSGKHTTWIGWKDDVDLNFPLPGVLVQVDAQGYEALRASAGKATVPSRADMVHDVVSVLDLGPGKVVHLPPLPSDTADPPGWATFVVTVRVWAKRHPNEWADWADAVVAEMSND